MADASVFTLGVPTYLIENGCLGSRPWKQQKTKLLLRGERMTFSLNFKKLPNSVLESWQRVGFWLNVETAVMVPAAAKLLGLKPTAALLSGGLYPPAGTNPLVTYAWNTHDETHEALAAAVGERVAPLIDAVVAALDHEAGYEAAAWSSVVDRFAYEGGFELPWATPSQSLSTNALPLSVQANNRGEACAHYAAALLLRQAHAEAAQLIALLERRDAELTDSPLWQPVRAEIARQQAAALKTSPLAATDWDFVALEAEIAERAASALLASSPAAKSVAAVAPVAWVEPASLEEAPPTGSIWEVLASALRPATFCDEPDGLGFATAPAVFEWESLCAALAKLTDDERAAFAAHEATLDAALAKMPDAYRRTQLSEDDAKDWTALAAKGEPPLGWTLARSLALESDVTIDAALTEQLRHLHIYGASELGRVAALSLPQVVAAEFAWDDLTLALAETLFAALPALHSVQAEISDGALAELAKADVATRFEQLLSTSSGSFDKGLKALAKRKDLSRLRTLSLNSDVKAPAIKALLKAAWAPQLESLTIGRSSAAGCKELLAGLEGPLAALRTLKLRCDVDLEATVLPPGLTSLHIQPSYGGLERCAAANPELPLRHLVLDGYGIELPTAEQLAAWQVATGLEELAITVHNHDDSPYRSFFERLAAREWPALRNVALQLYEPDDSACEGLAAWLARCPHLQALQIQAYQPTVTVAGAGALAEAVRGVRLLEAQLPPLIEALAGQQWPELVSLQLSMQANSSELTLPIRRSALSALSQKMPRLRLARFYGGQLEADALPFVEELRALPSLVALVFDV